MTTAVGAVYLAWVPLGIQPMERFLASYAHFSAGLNHDLIVIFNGQQSPADLAPFQELLSGIEHIAFPIAAPQQDIASYFDVADAFLHESFCFLNSYSEIQAADWLRKLHEPLVSPNVGLVGATASWESRQLVVPFRQLRTWLRFWRHNRRWPGFPSPHIRSTGFMLAREQMGNLRRAPIRTKEDAYEFENGFHSLTRQVQARGLKTLLVDRNGRAWEPSQWAQTRTFRMSDQRELLVTDNRTALYAEAGPEEKRRMSRMAWGDAAPPI